MAEIISIRDRIQAQTLTEIKKIAISNGTAETKAAQIIAALDSGLGTINNPADIKSIQETLISNGVLTPDVRRVMTQLDNALHNLASEAGESGVDSSEQTPDNRDTQPELPTVEVVDPTAKYEQDRSEIIRDTLKELTDDIKRGRAGSAVDLAKKVARWRTEIDAFNNDLLRTRLTNEINDAEQVATGIADARRRIA